MSPHRAVTWAWGCRGHVDCVGGVADELRVRPDRNGQNVTAGTGGAVTDGVCAVTQVRDLGVLAENKNADNSVPRKRRSEAENRGKGKRQNVISTLMMGHHESWEGGRGGGNREEESGR